MFILLLISSILCNSAVTGHDVGYHVEQQRSLQSETLFWLNSSQVSALEIAEHVNGLALRSLFEPLLCPVAQIIASVEPIMGSITKPGPDMHLGVETEKFSLVVAPSSPTSGVPVVVRGLKLWARAACP
jgi:hypothetical protein